MLKHMELNMVMHLYPCWMETQRYYYWIELKAYDVFEERERSFMLVNFKDEKDASSILRGFEDRWIDELMQKYPNEKTPINAINDIFQK